jgi:hypothetical protein
MMPIWWENPRESVTMFKGQPVPQSKEPILVQHLPAGAYRATLETKERRLVSDCLLGTS